jgi:FAD-dependent oxidoreductase domain-containing protein 1
MQSDVVIIGGGVVGSSVGWHLREHGFTGRVVVVERDRSYFRASSFLAMGGIRQQFCTAVTVQMVQHSVAFWKKFDQRMGTPRARPRAWFRQRGYLFLADAATAPALMRRYELERRAGARVRMLAPDEIRELVPDAWLDDIIFGMLGPEDGYANPREVLSGFHRAAEGAGVEYLEANVASLTLDGSRVTGVVLEDGTSVTAGVVVNAAGAWAGDIARMAGLPVPVSPMRQMLFRCTLPRPWPHHFPMLIDPGGVHWRHDDAEEPGGDDRIVLAFTNWNEPEGENFAVDESRWTSEFYPAMVRRVPALAGVRDVYGWSGLYEMTPDHNPVLGEHPERQGLIFANGFSGHGLMMSPATGVIVSEMIRLGRSETFDVSIFAPDRFERGALVHDLATI